MGRFSLSHVRTLQGEICNSSKTLVEKRSSSIDIAICDCYRESNELREDYLLLR